MTFRVVVTAKCESRHHVLGELLAVPDGLVIRVRHPAAGRTVGGRVHNKRGRALFEPLYDSQGDPSMSYPAMCACGVTHLVSASDLERARARGAPVVIVAPVR
jgi:hypothetical protein